MDLAEVVFVRDYVQLGFDGPAITANTLPCISVLDKWYKPLDMGWRDALCACIGHKVVAAATYDKSEIRIDFEGNMGLTISLKEQDYRGPEAASFCRDGKNLAAGWWFW